MSLQRRLCQAPNAKAFEMPLHNCNRDLSTGEADLFGSGVAIVCEIGAPMTHRPPTGGFYKL